MAWETPVRLMRKLLWLPMQIHVYSKEYFEVQREQKHCRLIRAITIKRSSEACTPLWNCRPRPESYRLFTNVGDPVVSVKRLWSVYAWLALLKQIVISIPLGESFMFSKWWHWIIARISLPARCISRRHPAHRQLLNVHCLWSQHRLKRIMNSKALIKLILPHDIWACSHVSSVPPVMMFMLCNWRARFLLSTANTVRHRMYFSWST